MTENAWGEEIDESKVSPVYQVPEEERLDTDDEPDANAMQSDPIDPDSADDDLGGWKPGDLIGRHE